MFTKPGRFTRRFTRRLGTQGRPRRRTNFGCISSALSDFVPWTLSSVSIKIILSGRSLEGSNERLLIARHRDRRGSTYHLTDAALFSLFGDDTAGFMHRRSLV